MWLEIFDVVIFEAIALVVRLVGDQCDFVFAKGDRTMNDGKLNVEIEKFE